LPGRPLSAIIKLLFLNYILKHDSVRAVEGVAVMSGVTYFDQECPTCGRCLKIRVEYLGKHVVCQHCRGEFEACDPDSASYPPSDSGIALMRRAEELLASAGTSKARPR
jgi:hypothetical protein